ncbi:hypothetical protein SRABI112_04922 [Pseudomonas mediterranea]|nr:hypothetical protein SRABI112_04922 [Pseudomonas mediterranea]
MVLRPDVDQLQQVAAVVVAIGLAVIAEGGRIEPADRTLTLSTRFPSDGLDQLIEAVVTKTTDRDDALVGEVAHRQDLILDLQYVTHGVVGIDLVLQRLAGSPHMALHQPSVLSGVSERGLHAVAGHFPFDPALGVVVDLAHQRLPLALALQQQLAAGQPAIAGQYLALSITPGVDLLQHIAQRTETPGRQGTVARFEQGFAVGLRRRPVRHGPIQAETSVQGEVLAGQGKGRQQQGARRVIVTEQLSVLIEGLLALARGAILHPLDAGARLPATLFEHRHRAEQVVEDYLPLRAPAIPASQAFTGEPGQVELPARIDTVRQQHVTGQRMHRRKIGRGCRIVLLQGPQARVPLLDHTPGRVEKAAVDPGLRGLTLVCAAIIHRTNRQEPGIHRNQPRRTVIHAHALDLLIVVRSGRHLTGGNPW